MNDQHLIISLIIRSGYTDYVKVPIFPDFYVNFPIFPDYFPDFHKLHFPILCKLDNLTLITWCVSAPDNNSL